MDKINGILGALELQQTRGTYQRTKDKLMQRMREELPTTYEPAAAYTIAVEKIFYNEPHADMLSAQDRERCIVALLASRDADVNLALHMYLALMEGVAPGEIAHILLLAGVYSGVASFTDGLRVEGALLTYLKENPGVEADKVLDGLSAVIRF